MKYAGFQKNQITDMRNVFCGDTNQHEEIFSSARQFLVRKEPGAFIVGGTNLTGKTSLVKRIMDKGGLSEFDLFDDNTTDPSHAYFRSDFYFADFDGTPIQVDEKRFYFSPRASQSALQIALDKGVQTIFLKEVWAGHTQGISYIADELVRKHGCKVVFDAVSSEEGRGFFDGEANNRFIQTSINSIFKPNELALHTLKFNIQALIEGVMELANFHSDWEDFNTAIRIFGVNQSNILVQAARKGTLESELRQMLDAIPPGNCEKR